MRKLIGMGAIIVAPHAGAWIETAFSEGCSSLRKAAPHAGAWIETMIYTATIDPRPVAPHAGAWIET